MEEDGGPTDEIKGDKSGLGGIASANVAGICGT